MKTKTIRKDFPQKLLNSREEQGHYQTTTGQRRNHRSKYPSPPFLGCVLCHAVTHDSLQRQRPQLTRLLCPWDFPDKNTGVGCLLQGMNIPDPGTKPASLVSLALADGFYCTTWEAPLFHLPLFFFCYCISLTKFNKKPEDKESV